MPSPDQMGSPFAAARAMPLTDGYGGKINAQDELPIHALGDDYAVEGSGTVNRLPSMPSGITVFLRMIAAPTFKNSARLICPNNVDYVATAGDLAIARSDGDGVWRLFVNSASGVSLADRALSLSASQQNRVQGNAGIPAIMRSYLAGLTLSTAGSSATFGVAVGVAADSTNVDIMTLASAYTKTTGSWALGSGNGALDASTIAINNWYYVFQIKRPDTGVVDICISASPTAPTVGGNIPAAYTLFRRIGAILTDASSQWRKFSQIGNEFLWDVPSRDLNGGNIATGPGTLVNLLVPNQIKVRAFVAVEYGTSGTVFGLVTSPDQADTASGTANFNMVASATNTNAMFYGEIRTNASGQIRVRTDVAITGNAYVFNRGWSDNLGRDS